ncbi:MAG: 2-dehydropantoate 2-reductase [Glaciecola sp.]|jgi:2-dehydropantoate 2-reductase
MDNEMANTQIIKRIGIIGRGAIGVNIAFNLQFVECVQTTLLVKEHYDRSDVLSLLTVDGEKHIIKCNQAYISKSILQPLDLIILPVKQYQIERLLLDIAEYLDTKTTILLLHNGMGGIQLVQKYLPNNPLLVATTTDGVYKTSTTCFIQTAVGQFDIGAIYEENVDEENVDEENVDEENADEESVNEESIDEEKPIEKHNNSRWNYLSYLHPRLLWRSDMAFALYQKLAVNAAINPLTAIKNCKNGELVHYSEEVKKVKEEIFDLYEFMNLPIDNHALSLHIDNVIQLTKENYSSMHQDFQNKRETEVEGILGFLLEKGKETGMKMAFIQTLYEQIKAQST